MNLKNNKKTKNKTPEDQQDKLSFDSDRQIIDIGIKNFNDISQNSGD